MRRKIILFTSALAVVLGAMTVYLITYVGSDAGPTARPGVPLTQPDDGPTGTVFGTDWGTGKDLKVPIPTKVRRTDPRTGQVTEETHIIGRLEAEESRILAPGRFYLVRPRFWYYLKGGQTIMVQSDSGEFFATEAAAQMLNPKRGILTGHVFMLFDRNGDPDRPRPELRPSQTIRFYMDQVEFDYSDNLIRTDSAFRMEMDEADIEAPGMSLRMDPVSREIVELLLNTHPEPGPGRRTVPARMIVRRGLEMLGSPAKADPPAPQGGAAAGTGDPQPAGTAQVVGIAQFAGTAQAAGIAQAAGAH